MRFSFPGNSLHAGVHYDPLKLAVYSADRAAVRMGMALGKKFGDDYLPCIYYGRLAIMQHDSLW